MALSSSWGNCFPHHWLHSMDIATHRRNTHKGLCFDSQLSCRLLSNCGVTLRNKLLWYEILCVRRMEGEFTLTAREWSLHHQAHQLTPASWFWGSFFSTLRLRCKTQKITQRWFGRCRHTSYSSPVQVIQEIQVLQGFAFVINLMQSTDRYSHTYCVIYCSLLKKKTMEKAWATMCWPVAFGLALSLFRSAK